MKLHRYVDHQRLHIVTKDVISLSISVLLLFRHYISHKITFGAPSSGGVLRSACGAFITNAFTLSPLNGVFTRGFLNHINKQNFLMPSNKFRQILLNETSSRLQCTSRKIKSNVPFISQMCRTIFQ